MSQTTGIVLATGAVTVVNQSVFNGQPFDWRVPIATGISAVGFTLAERVWPEGAKILAWTAFLTIMLTRVNPKVPSPAESALKWFNQGK